MIIPSDQVLSRSVEFYDPNRRVVYLERDFWQRYFSMLLKDFAIEMGVQPSSLMKRRLASRVKDVLYEYWHTKFVEHKEYGTSLWKEINRCFMSVANINERTFPPSDAQVTSLALSLDEKLTTKEDVDRFTAAEREADGSEVVDELVNDYAQMEYDSLKEIEMEAIVEEASRNFYNEKEAIRVVKEDYQKGVFSRFLTSDVKFSNLTDMVFEQATIYKEEQKKSIGEVTLWNLVDVKEILRESKATLQDFTVARFNNFYKQYSRILVFRRLVERIGYDLCELIYRDFVKTLNFNYVNVYEYVFCTIFLCDFCKRSFFSRTRYSMCEGFISIIRRGNTGLFDQSYGNVSSPFQNISASDRAAIICANLQKSASLGDSNVVGNSLEDKKKKRDSIFSNDGGSPFSNVKSTDFVFGQRR